MENSRNIKAYGRRGVAVAALLLCGAALGAGVEPGAPTGRNGPARVVENGTAGAAPQKAVLPVLPRVPASELKAVGASKASSSPSLPAAASEQNTKISGSTMQTLASLVGVVALIGVLGFTVRLVSRRSGGLMAALGAGGRAPSGLLEVLGRFPVGRGNTLVLLKMDRRVLLVSQGGGGKLGGATMTTLCEVTDPEDVASILLKVRDADGDSIARRFETMLSGAEKSVAVAMADPVTPRAGVAERPPAKRLEVGPDSFDLTRARHAPTPKHAPNAIRARLDGKRTVPAGLAKPRTMGGTR